MAPLGILTGIMSAIHVCGGPSLRSLIGRAQDEEGIAKAELCFSTSRDVCELYHNDAIVRVFGRPKILEIVYDIVRIGEMVELHGRDCKGSTRIRIAILDTGFDLEDDD
ncbi:hypothetical protein V8C35DRAFT_330965 [Trichoderma chlorosporum]